MGAQWAQVNVASMHQGPSGSHHGGWLEDARLWPAAGGDRCSPKPRPPKTQNNQPPTAERASALTPHG